MLEGSQPRSLRACSRDDPECGARRGVLRRAARNRSPREAREVARQALRPGCEELAARIRVMPETEARPRVKNRHGGAPRGERPASWDARRLARRLACRVVSAFTRVFDALWHAQRVPLHPTTLGAPPTLIGVSEAKVQSPDAKMRRGNEMGCLTS